jgi:hypothetical protein
MSEHEQSPKPEDILTLQLDQLRTALFGNLAEWKLLYGTAGLSLDPSMEISSINSTVFRRSFPIGDLTLYGHNPATQAREFLQKLAAEKAIDPTAIRFDFRRIGHTPAINVEIAESAFTAIGDDFAQHAAKARTEIATPTPMPEKPTAHVRGSSAELVTLNPHAPSGRMNGPDTTAAMHTADMQRRLFNDGVRGWGEPQPGTEKIRLTEQGKMESTELLEGPVYSRLMPRVNTANANENRNMELALDAVLTQLGHATKPCAARLCSR